MGYKHILNLYKCQDILIFNRCWALEKIHGTSAHITLKDGQLTFFSGGEKHANFVVLFDAEALKAKMELVGTEVVVFGEAYGGSQQGQKWRYGDKLKFVVFEVKVGDYWLNVPNADQVCQSLGLEFVYYKMIPTDMASIDAERDAPSEQAKRNGVVAPCPREGVVLRPVIELLKNNGERICAKHKRDEERETKTPRVVDDPAKLAVLEKAEAIALEWVTPIRFEHVLDKIKAAAEPDCVVGTGDFRFGPEHIGQVIKAMVDDVVREGIDEIVDSKEARKAIGSRASQLFKERLKAQLK